MYILITKANRKKKRNFYCTKSARKSSTTVISPVMHIHSVPTFLQQKTNPLYLYWNDFANMAELPGRPVKGFCLHAVVCSLTSLIRAPRSRSARLLLGPALS